MTKSTIPFYGKITLFEVGQWKPITIVPLDSTSTVAIHVPLTAEYVDNAEEVIKGQINADKPDPIWTDKGTQYIYDKLTDMVNPTVKPEDFTTKDKPEEVDEW